MNDDSQILIARLLTHQTLRRDDKLVKRALSDELFRADLDARLAACGMKLLDNVYADHVTLALLRAVEPKIFGARDTWQNNNFGLARDGVALLFRHGPVDLHFEDLGVPADGVERRAQLVAHDRQEVALGLVGLFRRVARLLGLP